MELVRCNVRASRGLFGRGSSQGPHNTLTNIVYWKLVKPKLKEERHFTRIIMPFGMQNLTYKALSFMTWDVFHHPMCHPMLVNYIICWLVYDLYR